MRQTNIELSKVSIIVPMYNIEQYLSSCIESIINQDYENIEVLLVNDGSTDRTGAIAKSFALKDERIKYLEKENGGSSSARNFGLANSTGEWIMYVDGDDWIQPDMVSKMIETAGNAGADVVIGDLKFVYPDYSYDAKGIDWTNNKNESLKRYLASVWTTLCGTMQRRELYDRYALRSPENVAYCEDFHLMSRMCYYARKVVHISESFYNYRQQEASITHQMNPKTQQDEIWVYLDTIEFFKNKGIYDLLKEQLGWRSIKALQDMVLDKKTFEFFTQTNRDKNQYILSCPYIGLKLKTIMWLLTHNMKPLASLIVAARKALGR